MSYIGQVAHCATLAIQRDLDKAKAIEDAVDDTQVMLAQRHLYGPLVKPDGMTDAEWEFWRRQEWTPEEIARIRVTRSNKPHYSRSVEEYERWTAFEGNPSDWR